MRLSGRAPPRSRVELASPEGDRRTASADARGVWSLKLPAGEPHLYALSALTAGGRGLHAEGGLVIVPGSPAQAVMVRAGSAALPLDPLPHGGISTVDYDPGGSIAVAGAAAPHAQLTLEVDGAAAAMGQADEQGRYALTAASRRLALGPHLLQVRGPGAAAVRTVRLQPPAPLAAPYVARREPDGWRVEWGLNGGGVQTTLILDR